MPDDVELTPVREHHRFDEARLQQFLQQRIDDDFAGMQVLQFEGGQSNPTFEIAGAERRYVLRKKPPGELLRSAHAVDREYRVISALAETAVPVPRTYLLCEDSAIIGTAFYVMERVEGRVFLDTRLPNQDSEERRAIWRHMVEVGAALHNVDHERVGLGDFGRPGNYYARQIHRWSEQYKASETEKNESMDSIMEWLPRNIPEAEEATIVHGDFRLGNCIVHPHEPRIVALLDWELSTIGHPLTDLSYWASLEYYGDDPFPRNNGELGLPDEEELVDHYCELTGRDGIPNWTFFIVFNLFRSAAIRQGVYKRGLDGNASSDRWQVAGPGGRAAANRAWELVKEHNLA